MKPSCTVSYQNDATPTVCFLTIQSRSAVDTKSCVLQHIMPRSPYRGSRRLGGTFLLQIQCRTICRTRNRREVGSKRSLRYIPPKRRLTFSELQIVISHKIKQWTDFLSDVLYGLHLRGFVSGNFTTSVFKE
jgi:hypothetical protein